MLNEKLFLCVLSSSLDTIILRFIHIFSNCLTIFTRRLIDDLIHKLVFTFYSLFRNKFYSYASRLEESFQFGPHARPQRFVDRQRLKPLRKPLALTSDTTRRAARALLTMIMLMMMMLPRCGGGPTPNSCSATESESGSERESERN